MVSILTNTAASNANSNINMHSKNTSSSIGKLSSGSRIVRASDDAASLAISNKLKADIATLGQAKSNASQTSSLLQIASGGASRISDLLTRMKTLATQSVNGTLSNSERLIAQEEFNEMINEIDNTVDQTALNGIKLLAGNGVSTFNAGANVDSAGLVETTLNAITGARFDESSIALGNFTGAVEGTVNDVRVTQNDAGTNYIIEIDLKNGAQVETFRAEVSQTTPVASINKFSSTTNDNNSFTAVNGVAALVAGAASTIENELSEILGIGTNNPSAFKSANIVGTANVFRSDVTAVSNLVGTVEYASETTDAGTTTATDTITIAGSRGTATTAVLSGTDTVGDIRNAINAISDTTGVAATVRDDDGDGTLNLVVYSLDPSETFTISNGAGTPLAAVGITTGSTSTAQTAGGYDNIISVSSSTDEGTYTLTSSFDLPSDTTTFRIQDQAGNVYEGSVENISDLSDDASLTKVAFGNGLELTFTNDQLRKTSSDADVNGGADQITFGSNNYEFRFEVEKSGNVSVTSQIGLETTDTITVALDAVSTEALGITNASGSRLISIDTIENAAAAQLVIDDAIDTLNTNTARIGALQSRFEQIDRNLSTIIENSTEANGTFVDVDFAAESSNFFKNQALMQAAVGIASQANQLPQNLLRLVG